MVNESIFTDDSFSVSAYFRTHQHHTHKFYFVGWFVFNLSLVLVANDIFAWSSWHIAIAFGTHIESQLWKMKTCVKPTKLEKNVPTCAPYTKKTRKKKLNPKRAFALSRKFTPSDYLHVHSVCSRRAFLSERPSLLFIVVHHAYSYFEMYGPYA